MLDVFPPLAIAPGGKGRAEIAIGACVQQMRLCIGAKVCSSTATVLAPSKCQGTRSPVPGLDVRGELLQLQLFMTLATILKAAQVLFRGTSILEYKFGPDYNSVTHF